MLISRALTFFTVCADNVFGYALLSKTLSWKGGFNKEKLFRE